MHSSSPHRLTSPLTFGHVQRKPKKDVDASTTTMLNTSNDKSASEIRKRSTAQNSSSSETIPASTLERAPERADTTPNGDADIVWGKTPSGNRASIV